VLDGLETVIDVTNVITPDVAGMPGVRLAKTTFDDWLAEESKKSLRANCQEVFS